MYLIKPVDDKWKKSQSFGENPQIYKQFGMKGHNGIDWATPNGTPIYASRSGKVIHNGKKGGYGLCIRQWVEGVGELIYAHLQKTIDNSYLKEGQLLGYADNTGFSTGPHLHFGYRPLGHNANNGYHGWEDPEPYLISKQSYMDLVDDVKRHESQIQSLLHENHLRMTENKNLKKEIKKMKKRKWGAKRVPEAVKKIIKKHNKKKHGSKKTK